MFFSFIPPSHYSAICQSPDSVPAPENPQNTNKENQSLRPFKPLPLDTLRKAVNAQEGPSSSDLEMAWKFYQNFRGSWQPGAPKPTPEELSAFDAFKDKLEKEGLPEWFLKLEENAGKSVARTMIFDPTNSGFSEFRQTEETERIKSLGIVYLAEHEIDRPGTAEKGAMIISTLMAKTTFDFELHALYARFLADAQMPVEAIKEARLAIYLNPNPTKEDLSFTVFIALIATGKEGWNLVQSMLREAAAKPEDAESVIHEWDRNLQKGEFKVGNVPIAK